jgi:hypothetical protein
MTASTDKNSGNMWDPLKELWEQYGNEASKTKNIACGMKYTAVMLDNDSIGVCANLDYKAFSKMPDEPLKHIHEPACRILLIACLNAFLNEKACYSISGDIFEDTSFGGKKNILMVGFFKPLVNKFKNDGIPLQIFDKIKSGPELSSMNDMNKALAGADTIILTSTSIINNTYNDIVSRAKTDAEILLLGPSATFSPLFFKDNKLKKIYGTIFNKNDEEVLKIIASGGGTKLFQPRGKKVSYSI